MDIAGTVNIVCALAAEARPLIDALRLEAVGDGRPFPSYRRRCEGGELRLVVSGVGKVAAAAAVGHLAGCFPQRAAAWLDVGIAGHRDLDLGSVVLAHKIVDRASGATAYPVLVFAPPCATVEVETVDRPDRSYAGAAAVDMEASGFFAAANRMAPAELVQAFKVISDNAAAPAGLVTKATARGHIDASLEPIVATIGALGSLAAELAHLDDDPPELATFLESWRFSRTQQHRLRRLLGRWTLRSAGRRALASCVDARDARAVLTRLHRELEALPVRLAGDAPTTGDRR